MATPTTPHGPQDTAGEVHDHRPGYYRVFAALMVLTAITVAIAYVDLGRWNLPVAMLIATGKAALVVLIFMHVRHQSRLTWVFAGAGFFWLIFLFGFTFTDYLTRDLLPFYGN